MIEPLTGRWVHAWGGPVASGCVRAKPEDFRVTEELNHSPDGEGEHVYVYVEKRGQNTQWVADRLAKFCGARPRDTGFAGMKDRNAVTRQWFSVRPSGRDEPDWNLFNDDGVTVLDVARHRRKLRRGAITKNRFEIAVVSLRGERARLEDRLRCIITEGVPNYFGEQRFGHGGRNIDEALALFSGKRSGRARRSLYLSAARAWLFNELLSLRIQNGTWRRVHAGDTMMLTGGRSIFPAPAAELDALQARLERNELQITGPLAGGGDNRPAGEPGEMERRVFDANPRLFEGLVDAGLEADRRPLSLVPRNLDWRLDGDRLSLVFELPAGGYATSVLREIVSY